MRTPILPADPPSIERASEILRAGGLVAFPTETVYGLGARADDSAAVLGIFRAKGRPAGNPLIVHVAGVEAAERLCLAWPREAAVLAEAFWPGPLTLVLPRRLDRVAPEVAAGGPTVAIRIPAHPVARALLDACGLPIAAPSANASTSISPTTAEHVLKSLGGRIDLILDGGPTGYGIESTIVDVSASPARVLRLGAIPRSAIEALAPVVDDARRIVDPKARAAAPGSHARHYAPHARVFIVARSELAAKVVELRARFERVGALDRASEEGEPLLLSLSADVTREVVPGDPAGYAASLYAALHRLEDAGCTSIVIVDVPEGEAWAAVRDRLTRAAAPA